MATKAERTAEDVVERQMTAVHHLMNLRQHSTVRSNPVLREEVESVWEAIKEANAYACLLWFPRDTHSDLPPHGPAAGAVVRLPKAA